MEQCEQCEKFTTDYVRFYQHIHFMCVDCQEERFCECGAELETKGDGFCRKCD